ncbi:MAG: PorT family protein [Prevotella sp.]|nr:PorT family protein [Prevotella sp.]
MKQDEWTQRLRDHLADYEAPVPDDLWAKIEAQLPKDLVAEKPKARAIPLWVRWASAAAFIGILIGTTALLWPSHEELPAAPLASATEKAHKTSMESKETSETAITKIAISEAVATKPTIATEPAVAIAEAIANTAQQDTTATPSLVKDVDSAPVEKEPEQEKSQQMLMRELDQKIATYKEHRSRRATVSLYASNGFGDLSNRNGVLMSAQMLANYDYDSRMGISSTRSGGPVFLANYEERQKYYQPISFGLTANIPISSVISLSSGIVYTRLSADFTNIANNLVYQEQQTLHYIGIPLNVQYHVWRWRGFNVYATAGGQADINVKVHLESDGLEQEMKKDQVQWSVGGALGVQYDIIPQLGLYAEPGIKYYFDNGSHIRNYFKYHPTNFNLQVGLRLNMGK